MVGTPAASAVFDFENILPQLDFLPIAARRALDHAGLRLSLEAWRSLGLDDRCQLVAAGADDVVDSSSVAAVVRRASPPAQRIEVVGDPDPLAPPDGLSRLAEPVPLDARQWARLRALDRYALAHVHRRSIARNDPSLIQSAYEDIVTGHLRSMRPSPGEVAGRGFGSTAPPPQVPPPPPLPRTGDALRAPRAYDPTPSPGRAQEARGHDAPQSPGRAQEARGYDAPLSPRRAQEARGYEAPPPAVHIPEPPFRSFDASLPVGPDIAPVAQRGARAQDAHHQEASLDFGYEPPPLARAYEPPSPERSSSIPPPASRPSTRPTPPSRRAVELVALEEEHRFSSHLTETGDAHMVDVGAKPITARRAVASATVRMRRETFRSLAQRETPKGDVLAAARIAGIQAAKRTSDLIPLCHGISLTHVEVQIELDGTSFCVHIAAVAEARDRTGVEMEAMVAASVASLTIYDMLKGIDRDMSIDDIKLLEKSGGRTGHYHRREA